MGRTVVPTSQLHDISCRATSGSGSRLEQCSTRRTLPGQLSPNGEEVDLHAPGTMLTGGQVVGGPMQAKHVAIPGRTVPIGGDYTRTIC